MTTDQNPSGASAELGLLEGIGIEIETMLVDARTLDVAAVVDRVLARANGGPIDDHADGPVDWSNELVGHVIELKNAGPVRSFEGVAENFQASVGHLVEHARALGVRPMPCAMHPWMVPPNEAQLWTHDYAPVYRAYDAIFDCRRHGWANVQSTHLNLSFGDDAEFARLLAAIRLVLPWIPALAASSPLQEGLVQPTRDTRLVHYRHHADRVPELVGPVIPEPIYDPQAYRTEVLRPISVALAKLDTDGQFAGREWINGRGAIARFDRNAIEIRLIDVQECVAADTAIAAAVYGAVRLLTEDRFAPLDAYRERSTAELFAQLEACVRDAERAPVLDAEDLVPFGAVGAADAGALWRRVVEHAYPPGTGLERTMDGILARGSLATRIVEACGPSPDRARLHQVYGELCACYEQGSTFRADRDVADPRHV